MAKKKQAVAASNGGATTRPRAKKREAASNAATSEKSGNNKAPARGAKQQQGPSTPLIGEVAGKVWQALSDEGPQSVGALKKAVGVSDEVVLLAIGWLAREDKLEFETTGRTTTISLR